MAALISQVDKQARLQSSLAGQRFSQWAFCKQLLHLNLLNPETLYNVQLPFGNATVGGKRRFSTAIRITLSMVPGKIIKTLQSKF